MMADSFVVATAWGFLVGILYQAESGARASELSPICCSGQCYEFASGLAYKHLPKPRCPDGDWPTFDLYTRSTKSTPNRTTKGSIPPSFGARRRTIFIVHGFLSEGKTPWIIKMKNELLNVGDYNVIAVDWAKGAHHGVLNFYKKAASTTRVVGRLLADIAEHLVTSGGADRRQMWCVGHSLGAHTCGEAGAAFRIGRVTGLDPAGPSFSNHSNIGLRRTSADFVDVIHTDQTRVLCCGDVQPRGHVDFYPNGGRKQPGCWTKRGTDQSEWFGCNHKKAFIYFTDSINRCSFYSNIECSDATKIYKDWKKSSCVQTTDQPLQEMGFHADQPKYRREGLFYVETEGACSGKRLSVSVLLVALLPVLSFIF